MRVATRRQRAAWRVFGDAFDLDRTDRHRRRLKLVARDLGGVRDLDVLIEAGEAYQRRQSAAEARAFEPLLRSWRVQRDAAREVLIKELDSNRYRKWLDAYVEFLQADGVGARQVGPTDPHRVRDTMPSRIWTAYEVVRAYEPVMRWADVTTLHDLRIAAKWLRYTLEFVREALGRDAGPVIEKVVALQDHLGWLHDADVAANLARRLPRGARGTPVRGGERRHRAVPRRPRAGACPPAADGRSAVARRGQPRVPARARTGRRGTLARGVRPVRDPLAARSPSLLDRPVLLGPAADQRPGGGRARPGPPPRRRARAPRGSPPRTRVRRSALVALQDRVHDDRARPAGSERGRVG